MNRSLCIWPEQKSIILIQADSNGMFQKCWNCCERVGAGNGRSSLLLSLVSPEFSVSCNPEIGCIIWTGNLWIMRRHQLQSCLAPARNPEIGHVIQICNLWIAGGPELLCQEKWNRGQEQAHLCAHLHQSKDCWSAFSEPSMSLCSAANILVKLVPCS